MRDFLKKWSKFFWVAGFFSLFINLLYLTFPIYMLAVYDRVLYSYSMPTLITLTIMAATALIVMGGLDFLRSRLLVFVGVDMDKTLSRPIFSEMLKDKCNIKGLGYTEGLRDVNILRNYFSGNAIFSFFDAPWTPLYILVIFLMHPLLGYFAIAAALVLFLMGVFQEILTRRRLGESGAIEASAHQFANSCMRNAEVINAMGMTSGVTARWRLAGNEAVELRTSANNVAGAMSAATTSIRSAMQVLIFGLGAYLVIQNQSTPGIIIAASIIMRQALGPVERVMGTWRQTIDARSAYKRLDELIKAAPIQEDMELPTPSGKLEAEGASLLLDGTTILQNVSFHLESGQMMGLIGPSGAGKTSLCRLILGLWPSTAGKVRLDGYDVHAWDQEQLGPHIGYLPQDVELFPGTVSENIARMGEVIPEKVVSASQLAGIHEMVLKLPKGYDTWIGDSGVRLSGGQRQRIALARALYGNPKLVVLDEPNSNLDDAGERALTEALSRLQQKGITTVIVTHKPGLLSTVDRVLMLKEGQVAMFGPKEEVFQKLAAQHDAGSGQLRQGSATGKKS